MNNQTLEATIIIYDASGQPIGLHRGHRNDVYAGLDLTREGRQVRDVSALPYAGLGLVAQPNLAEVDAALATAWTAALSQAQTT